MLKIGKGWNNRTEAKDIFLNCNIFYNWNSLVALRIDTSWSGVCKESWSLVLAEVLFYLVFLVQLHQSMNLNKARKLKSSQPFWTKKTENLINCSSYELKQLQKVDHQRKRLDVSEKKQLQLWTEAVTILFRKHGWVWKLKFSLIVLKTNCSLKDYITVFIRQSWNSKIYTISKKEGTKKGSPFPS